jgi:hypothetical protein
MGVGNRLGGRGRRAYGSPSVLSVRGNRSSSLSLSFFVVSVIDMGSRNSSTTARRSSVCLSCHEGVSSLRINFAKTPSRKSDRGSPKHFTATPHSRRKASDKEPWRPSRNNRKVRAKARGEARPRRSCMVRHRRRSSGVSSVVSTGVSEAPPPRIWRSGWEGRQVSVAQADSTESMRRRLGFSSMSGSWCT